MKIKNFLMALVALTVLTVSCTVEESPVEEIENQDGAVVDGQYIVVFKEEAITSGRTNEPRFVDRAEKQLYSRLVA